MGLENHVFDHETQKSWLIPCYRPKINDFLNSYNQNLKIDIFTPLQQIPCYCKSSLAHYNSFCSGGSHITTQQGHFPSFSSHHGHSVTGAVEIIELSSLTTFQGVSAWGSYEIDNGIL